MLLQQESSECRKTGRFVVEGRREIAHCLEAGYEVESLYCCPQLMVASQRDCPPVK